HHRAHRGRRDDHVDLLLRLRLRQVRAVPLRLSDPMTAVFPEPTNTDAPDENAVDDVEIIEVVEVTEVGDLGDAELLDVVDEVVEVAPREPSPYERPGDWFVVHTYAGYENKVKQNLASRVRSMNVEEQIFEIVIPMEDVIEFKGGRKVVVQKKVFP